MKFPASYSLTFTGRRAANQDSCIAMQQKNLTFLAVADGMGGANGGEIASQQVIEVCKINIFEAALENPKPADLKKVLKKIFSESQERLAGIISEKPELRGMGTTMSCVLMAGNHYVWGNIGDSRVYLLKGQEIKKITLDHSLVEEYRQQYGNDIPHVIRQRSNVITRSLGGDKDEPDIYPADKDYETINKGEGFLICSDGLIPGKLENDPAWMRDYVLGTKNLKEASVNLVCHAFYQGSKDNISVVLYEHTKFNRKKVKLQKYSWPPRDKPAPVQPKARKKKKTGLKVLLTILFLVVAGFGGYMIIENKIPWLQKDEIPEQLKELAPPAETKGEKIVDETTPPVNWIPLTQTDINRFSIKNEQLHWTPYPDSESLVRYDIVFSKNGDEVRHQLGKKTFFRFIEAETPLKPGKYSVRVDAILRNGIEEKGNQIRIELIN